jgi:hypothetical protein
VSWWQKKSNEGTKKIVYLCLRSPLTPKGESARSQKKIKTKKNFVPLCLGGKKSSSDLFAPTTFVSSCLCAKKRWSIRVFSRREAKQP